MKCPFCGFENISGSDNCESCGEDLTAFDGVRPQDTLDWRMTHHKLNTIAKSGFVSVAPETTIKEVAGQMNEDNKICLVFEESHLVGILTVRDLLQKAMFKDVDFSKTPVSQFMTKNPETLDGEDKIVYALNKMAMKGYRHVPIKLKDGSYAVVSARDILAFLATTFPEVVGIHQS